MRLDPSQQAASSRAVDDRDELRREGFVILRGVVDAARVTGALRLINLSMRRYGLTAEQIEEWQLGTFFPHLRADPVIWATLPDGAAELLGWRPGDEWAEPQLVLRFPDEEQPWAIQPHVDELPPWARGRSYRGVVGVALTHAGATDGAVCVWPGSHLGQPSAPVSVSLAAGDALVMDPRLGHSGTLNLGPGVRAAIYFRLLAP